MQSSIQNFRQSSTVFEKQGILPKNRKLPKSLIFFVEIVYTFPTYQCLQKGASSFAWDFALINQYYQII